MEDKCKKSMGKINMNKNAKHKDVMFYCLSIAYICVVIYSIINMF